MKTPPWLSWTAEGDGTAHAHYRGLPRTLCGREVVSERYAWPTVRRCAICMNVAKEADPTRDD